MVRLWWQVFNTSRGFYEIPNTAMQLLPRLSLAFSGKHGLITVIEQSDNVVFISMQPNTGGAMVYAEHKSRIAFKLAYAAPLPEGIHYV